MYKIFKKNKLQISFISFNKKSHSKIFLSEWLPPSVVKVFFILKRLLFYHIIRVSHICFQFQGEGNNFLWHIQLVLIQP